MKVIIDSGHGGSDPGASGFGMNEKDLNLIFARLLATKLTNLNINVDTSLINNVSYTSVELTNQIKDSGADICISCHNNSFNGTARGFEAIHSIHTSGALAKYIADEVKKTGFPVRRTFSRESTIPSQKGQDFYYAIRLTYPKVETIIVEFGFIDNQEDFSMLTSPVWQDKLTAAVAAGVKRYAPAGGTSKTSIAGNALLTSAQLKRALATANPAADTSIVDMYYRIAPFYGIKADLAFLQAVHETNWFKFTGIVKAGQNNFAGIGAGGSSSPGASFPTKEIGVEAHIQHLYAYSTAVAIPAGRVLYDPRFNLVSRGSAPNWEDLNGKWAVPGIGYGERIVELLEIISSQYPPQTPDDPPAEPPVDPPDNDDPGQPAPVHWAKPDNDDLMKAGLLLSDHTDTLDKPASEGMVLSLINRLRKEFLKHG